MNGANAEPSVKTKSAATSTSTVTSGTSQSRYRVAGGGAPLKETLAAAVVLASGWQEPAPLLDPMCGTGTIAIEAALMAGEVAPGLLRARAGRFGFLRWRSFQPTLWRK